MKQAAVLAALLCFAILGISQTLDDKVTAKQNVAPSTHSSDASPKNKHQIATQAQPLGQTQVFVSYQNPAAEHQGDKQESRAEVDVQRQLAKFTKYLVWVGLLQALILAVQGGLFFSAEENHGAAQG